MLPTVFIGLLIGQAMCAPLKPEENTALAMTNPVAFTVYLSNDMCSVGSDQTVPFDVVVLNHGDGWKPLTHRFVAPVRGIYSFTVSAGACVHEDILVRLQRNDVNIGTTRGSPVNGYQAASTNLMVMLEADDVFSTLITQGYSLRGNERTFLSGFLYVQL